METVVFIVIIALLYIGFRAGRNMTRMQSTAQDSDYVLKQKQLLMQLFTKSDSLNIQQIVEKLNLEPEIIINMLETLMKDGLIDQDKSDKKVHLYKMKR